MPSEPSPRPWFVQNYVHHPDKPLVCDANGECVADDVSNANAALIVDAVNERDRLRDLVRRLTEYADAVTGYHPPAIEVVSSEHPAWTFDGAALLREARAAIGEEKP